MSVADIEAKSFCVNERHDTPCPQPCEACLDEGCGRAEDVIPADRVTIDPTTGDWDTI